MSAECAYNPFYVFSFVCEATVCSVTRFEMPNQEEEEEK